MFIRPQPAPAIPHEVYAQVSGYIQTKSGVSPLMGIILGSGLSSASQGISVKTEMAYGDIPAWPSSTVQGHPGKLVLGTLSSVPVIAMMGRAHFLEGYPMEVVTFPVRVMKSLGVKILIITNAAGGLTSGLAAGDLMLISDHINLPGLSGWDPLRGPNDDAFGERYPDMTEVYDFGLRDTAQKAAAKAGISLKEGVYICNLGPSFSTPSDLKLLRMFGADAVGMSTVPEAIVARHAGMRILGISCITDTNESPTHEEVLAKANEMSDRLGRLLKELAAELTPAINSHNDRGVYPNVDD